jgi:hypothetical protein
MAKLSKAAWLLSVTSDSGNHYFSKVLLHGKKRSKRRGEKSAGFRTKTRTTHFFNLLITFTKIFYGSNY